MEKLFKTLIIIIITADISFTIFISLLIEAAFGKIENHYIISFLKSIFLCWITPMIIGILISWYDKKNKFSWIARLPVYLSILLFIWPATTFGNITDLIGLTSLYFGIVFFIYYVMFFSSYAVIVIIIINDRDNGSYFF